MTTLTVTVRRASQAPQNVAVNLKSSEGTPEEESLAISNKKHKGCGYDMLVLLGQTVPVRTTATEKAR